MRRKIMLSLLLAGFSLGAAAQEILGTVTDKNKEPLVNASVVVKQSGIIKSKTVTDFDGNYSVKPLDAGYYDVEVSYVGYQTNIVTKVIVTAGEKTGLNFALQLSKGTRVYVH